MSGHAAAEKLLFRAPIGRNTLRSVEVGSNLAEVARKWSRPGQTYDFGARCRRSRPHVGRVSGQNRSKRGRAPDSDQVWPKSPKCVKHGLRWDGSDRSGPDSCRNGSSLTGRSLDSSRWRCRPPPMPEYSKHLLCSGNPRGGARAQTNMRQPRVQISHREHGNAGPPTMVEARRHHERQRLSARVGSTPPCCGRLSLQGACRYLRTHTSSIPILCLVLFPLRRPTRQRARKRRAQGKQARRR